MPEPSKVLFFYLNNKAYQHYSKALIEAFRKDFDLSLILNKRNHYNRKLTPGVHLNIPEGFLGLALYAVPFFVICLFLLIGKLAKKNKALIFIPGFHPYNIIIISISKLLGLETINTVHDYVTHIGERNALLEFVQKKCLMLSNKVVFLTEAELKKARIKGFAPKQYFVLPHPLPDVRSTHKLDYNPILRVLFLGRFREYKGINLIYECCQKLENVHFTLAGKGPLPEHWDHSRKNLNIINTWLKESYIKELVLSHHLLVLPYIDASQSGVLCMGLSYEIPMIISKNEGLKEQLDDTGALWIEANTASLMSAIMKISRSRDDYEFLKSSVMEAKQQYLSKWEAAWKEFIQWLN